nr:hypothetical protein [Xanthomonas arboricola]
MIERAATRALDLDFVEGAGLAQQAGAFVTTEVLEHCAVLRWTRLRRCSWRNSVRLALLELKSCCME